MRTEFIFILIFFYCNISQSQNVYSLKSSEDNSPIKYANIYENNKILTSSDSLGIFKINDKYLNSTIKIKALGYKTIDSVSIKKTLNIVMEVKPVTLNEVILTQKKEAEKFKLGKAKSGDIGIVEDLPVLKASLFLKTYPFSDSSKLHNFSFFIGSRPNENSL